MTEQEKDGEKRGTLWSSLLGESPAASAELEAALREKDPIVRLGKLVHIKKRIDSSPLRVDWHFAVGKGLLETGSPAEAAAYFRQVRLLAPNHDELPPVLEEATLELAIQNAVQMRPSSVLGLVLRPTDPATDGSAGVAQAGAALQQLMTLLQQKLPESVGYQDSTEIDLMQVLQTLSSLCLERRLRWLRVLASASLFSAVPESFELEFLSHYPECLGDWLSKRYGTGGTFEGDAQRMRALLGSGGLSPEANTFLLWRAEQKFLFEEAERSFLSANPRWADVWLRETQSLIRRMGREGLFSRLAQWSGELEDHALSDLSLAILRPHRVWWVIGEQQSGKSSLINALAGQKVLDESRLERNLGPLRRSLQVRGELVWVIESSLSSIDDLLGDKSWWPDGVLFVFDALQAGRKTEMRCLAKLNSLRIPVCFALHKADRLSPSEQDEVDEMLTKQLNQQTSWHSRHGNSSEQNLIRTSTGDVGDALPELLMAFSKKHLLEAWCARLEYLLRTSKASNVRRGTEPEVELRRVYVGSYEQHVIRTTRIVEALRAKRVLVASNVDQKHLFETLGQEVEWLLGRSESTDPAYRVVLCVTYTERLGRWAWDQVCGNPIQELTLEEVFLSSEAAAARLCHHELAQQERAQHALAEAWQERWLTVIASLREVR